MSVSLDITYTLRVRRLAPRPAPRTRSRASRATRTTRSALMPTTPLATAPPRRLPRSPPSPAPTRTPPSTPAGLGISGVGQTSMTLSWTASTDNVGVVGYRLYLNGTQVGTSSGTTYTYSSLACGTSSTLGVAAVDGAGNVSRYGDACRNDSGLLGLRRQQQLGGHVRLLRLDAELSGPKPGFLHQHDLQWTPNGTKQRFRRERDLPERGKLREHFP